MREDAFHKWPKSRIFGRLYESKDFMYLAVVNASDKYCDVSFPIDEKYLGIDTENHSLRPMFGTRENVMAAALKGADGNSVFKIKRANPWEVFLFEIHF